MPKKHKKPRLARDGHTSPSTTPARVSLTSLPIEILAEILLYTCSPPTVVAVSRTCSFLYHSLAHNPAASFIWRGVRKTCQPLPLPEPGRYWNGSEADYAAFMFGEGVCEVCQKTTRTMYVSFAARIRLCGSWYCRRKMLDEVLVNAEDMIEDRYRQSIWTPYVESNKCFHPSSPRTLTWPCNPTILLRKTDLAKFRIDLMAYEAAELARAEHKCADPLSAAVLEEVKQSERIMERCHAAVFRFDAVMEVSASLIHWKCCYDKEYKNIKRENKLWTKNLAEKEGWDLGDLVASQTYGSLQRRKNFLLEKIGSNDVFPIRSAIESELLAVQTHHKRQKAEATYKQKLTEIKKIYERMRCGTLDGARTDTENPSDSTGALILPPLSVFCTLPSVRALKGSPDPSAVPPTTSTSATIDIKSSPLATSLIESDLHTWLVPVQKYLMSLLGYPNGWQSASTRMLPPLQRVTARFFCRRCGEGRVGRAHQRERCLDLKGVCSHVCVATQGKSIEGRHQEAPQEGETEAPNTHDGNNKQEKGKNRDKKNSGAKTLDWKMDLFEKDEKAIRLIKQILELRGLSEEDPSTASGLSEGCHVIRCMSCEGWIVMDFDSAIGHAHRHESMQIQLLLISAPSRVELWKPDISAPNGHVSRTIPSSQLAFKRGTSELLLGPSHRAPNLCKKINYGCKHCFRVSETDVLVGVEKPDVGKGVRAMNFNGLRSHVKKKHGIQDIRDEDFFCYSAIQKDEIRGQSGTLYVQSWIDQHAPF